MGSATKSKLRSISFLLMLGTCVQGLANTRPENLPTPPPLPPSLKAPPPLPPDLPDPAELQAQLKQLGELLSMDPAKLNRLRQTIQFIENMSPDEREAMRIRLSQVTQATPEIRNEVRLFSNRFPTIDQFDLSQYWYAASKTERSAVREQLESLDSKGQLQLMRAKVAAFVLRRDEVFESMRKSLQEKKAGNSKQTPPPSDS